jgi:hypothetical protein
MDIWGADVRADYEKVIRTQVVSGRDAEDTCSFVKHLVILLVLAISVPGKMRLAAAPRHGRHLC